MKIAQLEKTHLTSASIRIMAEVLRQEGLDVDIALKAAALGRGILEDPEARVRGPQELAFQRAFRSLTPARPDLWLRTGRHYRILHFETVALLLLTAPNLDGAARASQYSSLSSFTLAHKRRIQERGFIIGFETDLTEVPEDIREFTAYRDMGTIMRFFEDLGIDWSPKTAQLAYPEPPAKNELDFLKDFPIQFNAERSRIIWGIDQARKPFPYSDSMLHERYLCQLKVLEKKRAATDTLLQRIIEILSRANAIHTIESTACEMGMSKRTLQRRLQDHDLTIHDLLSIIRMRQAKKMLTVSDLQVSEIAWRLGYADATAFSHAFRRRTGISPRAFRNRSEMPPARDTPRQRMSH